MKNKFLLQQFMDKNNLEFDKPFLVRNNSGTVIYKILEKEAMWGSIPQVEYFDEKKKKWIEVDSDWLMLIMFCEGYEVIKSKNDLEQKDNYNTNLFDKFMRENNIMYFAQFYLKTSYGIKRTYRIGTEKTSSGLIVTIERFCKKNNEWKKQDIKDFIAASLKEGYKIIKSVWKPKLKEYFYYIDEDDKVSSKVWNDSMLDKNYFLIGNCFRSPKEALYNKEIIKNLLNSDKPLV